CEVRKSPHARQPPRHGTRRPPSVQTRRPSSSLVSLYSLVRNPVNAHGGSKPDSIAFCPTTSVGTEDLRCPLTFSGEPPRFTCVLLPQFQARGAVPRGAARAWGRGIRGTFPGAGPGPRWRPAAGGFSLCRRLDAAPVCCRRWFGAATYAPTARLN